MTVRVCRSGSSRPSRRGRVASINARLIIVEVDRSGESMAFDKMLGTTRDGVWKILDDDLNAVHKSLSITG